MPGRPQGRVQLFRERDLRQTCASLLSHRLDYAADLLTFSVPRRCLQAARSVRVAGGSFWLRSETTRNSFEIEYYYDDPFRTGGAIGRVATTFTDFVPVA
jgi:hypothetical protein